MQNAEYWSFLPHTSTARRCLLSSWEPVAEMLTSSEISTVTASSTHSNNSKATNQHPHTKQHPWQQQQGNRSAPSQQAAPTPRIKRQHKPQKKGCGTYGTPRSEKKTCNGVFKKGDLVSKAAAVRLGLKLQTVEVQESG